jgi:hypothetical protein
VNDRAAAQIAVQQRHEIAVRGWVGAQGAIRFLSRQRARRLATSNRPNHPLADERHGRGHNHAANHDPGVQILTHPRIQALANPRLQVLTNP